MTPEEAAERFKRLSQMVARDMPQFITRRVAEDAAEKIRRRVTLQGLNYLGGAFKPYSRRPMLTSGKTEKSNRIGVALAGSKSKRKQLQWRTIKHKGKNVRLFVLPGGYAQMRRLEGLPTGHKDFEFTRKMWDGFGTKRTSKTNNEFVVTLGGKNVEAQMKINANSRREGINIINLSDQETKELAKIVDQELQRYINKVGLS
jgi:hypothetical protein